MEKVFSALRNNIGLWLAFSLLLTGCEHVAKLPYYNSKDFTPMWIKPSAATSLHRIAPFSFVDQNGQPVTEKTVAGKISVANFMFTGCPGLCPRMTTNLETVQKAFEHGSTVVLISHSVAPESDSIPALKRFAAEHHAVDGQWHFVTGDRAAIYRTARESYFADEAGSVPDAGGDFLHTEKVFLVDDNGHLRGVYNGELPTEMERLKEDIRTLKRAFFRAAPPQ